MQLKTLLLSLILTLTVFPAFSQSRETDILSSLIGSGASTSSGPLDIIASTAALSDSPLDFIAERKADSPLDYVRESTGNSLDIVTASLSPNAELGVLNSLTSTFNGTSFYSGGITPLLSASATPALPTFTKATGTGQYIQGIGRVSSGFGYRLWDKKMHNGVDIAMPVGDTVRVVRPGIVERISNEPGGYGNYVIIRHTGGLETRYAHLTRPLVTIGQSVAANQPIAISGNTGRSTGPHLHFEARFNGTPVDPMPILNGQTQPKEMPRSFSPEYHDGRPGSNLATKDTKNQNSARRTYVVKAGDTLSKIAERNGISVSRLCQLNFILDNEIPTPGTMLIVK